MNWVLDCSLAGAFGMPDEKSNIADKFMTKFNKNTIVYVPFLWWYEIINLLSTAFKKKRISDSIMIKLQHLYSALPVIVDNSIEFEIINNIRNISVTHNVSAYDAAYLELSLRRKSGIATLDRDIKRTAKKMGIIIFE